MKHTRNVYHYFVTKIKKNRDNIAQDRMLDSFLENKVPNLLKELKSQRSCSKPNVPSHIDGHSGKANIANHFASKYSDLYNSNESLAETNTFLDGLNITDSDLYDVDLVSPEVVYQAISCINMNKNDNNFDFKSNAILYAVDILVNHITLLLQSFLIHGYVPPRFNYLFLKTNY